MIFLRLHCFGIQSASRKSHGVRQILGVCVTLGGGEIEASCVTANAGLDVLKTVLDQLGDPLGIGQELTGHADGVDSSVRDGLGAHFRIHSTGANYRNIDKFLDVCHVVQIAVLRHVHRRMCPVPGVVRTVVGIQHVVACVLQITGGTLGFLHVTAHFGVVLTGHGTLAEAFHLGLYRVTEGNGEVLTAGFLDGANHLGGKTVTVFKASAVFVGALIEKLNGKLIQQIALMYGVYFHTVHTCVPAELGGLGECLNDLVNLLHRHLRTLDVVCPAGFLRAGAGQLVGGVENRLEQSPRELILMQRCNQLGDCPGTAHTGGQLDEQLGARLVDLVHELLQFFEHFRILPEPLTPECVSQRCDSGDNQTNVVVGSFKKELCRFLIEMAAGKLEPAEEGSAAHRAHDDTVLDFHVADFPRGE